LFFYALHFILSEQHPELSIAEPMKENIQTIKKGSSIQFLHSIKKFKTRTFQQFV